MDLEQLWKTKIRRNNNLYKILIDEVGSGPMDGACVALAMALKKFLGTGEVMSVIGTWNGHTQAQHAVLKVGGVYIDGDGPADEKKLLRRLEREEDIKDGALRPFKASDLDEAPRDPKLIDKLVAYLKGEKVEGTMSKAKKVKDLIEQLHDFQQALTSFLHDSQKKIDASSRENAKLEKSEGPKYIRIIYAISSDGKVFSRSAWAFVDKESGDVYKPAGWKAPAKHARANIFKPNTWDTVTAYGPHYLR